MSPPERMVTAFGRTQSISDWERQYGHKRNVVATRLAAGWTPEDSVSLQHRSCQREMWEGANELPFDADEIARALLQEYGPFTLEEVGLFLGITREAVRLIETSALTKLKAGFEDCGIDAATARDILEQLSERREEGSWETRLQSAE